MKKVSTISRYLLGLMFLLAGITGLLNLAPPPKDMPEALMTFMNGMMAAKYFFPLLKGTETICGLFLLFGIAPALMLVILAPICLNIFLVHAFLTPGIQNLLVPLLILVLFGLAVVNYWHVYRPLFQRKP